MPVSKSSGPNTLKLIVLKVRAEISSPIADLVDLSFPSGKFPNSLKTSKIIQTFKKGSPLEPSNYRPQVLYFLTLIKYIFVYVYLKKTNAF